MGVAALGPRGGRRRAEHDRRAAFKPLPVAVCALLAPLGSAAPWLWVVLVRAAAVVAAFLAFGLARRLAGGSRAAGALGAVAVLLCGGLPAYTAAGKGPR